MIVGQSLPGGQLLEIAQWKRGDAERPDEGVVTVGEFNSLVAVRDELVLTLRAPVLLDSLAALAAMIRP